MKKLLFITTANLSTNPRLYKELKLAKNLGYKVTFVAFRQGGWSDEKDKLLINELEETGHYLSALRRPFLPWLISSIVNKISIWMWPFFKENLLIAAYAHNKRSYLLHHYLKKHHGVYDLVIGHNLGSLYPVYRFAKRKNIPFAFDVEDYHPGEASAYEIRGEVERRKFLLANLLPKSVYFSYASPLIGKYTNNLMKSSLFSHRLLINNTFPIEEFSFPSSMEGKIKLVWFSQTISFGRGLELIIPVLSLFRKEISLNLIGNLNKDFYDKWIKPNEDYTSVCEPLLLKDLLKILSEYDVGLALEPGKDENNLIALSNKIWTYLQSGLYIFATDTPAQKIFMDEFPSHGMIIRQDPESFRTALEHIIQHKDEIRKSAPRRYEKAQRVAWEVESKKLQNIWQEILTDGSFSSASTHETSRIKF